MIGKVRKYLAMLLTLLIFPAGAFGAGEDVKIMSPKTFSEGLMVYQNSREKFGYLDADGNVVIKAQFQSANAFHKPE